MKNPDFDYEAHARDGLRYQLRHAPIGAFITFAKERTRPYRVRARSGRFIVCTRPFEETVYYSIIDLLENCRGPENLVLGLGAESDQNCWDMVDRLDGRDNNHPQGKDAVDRVEFEKEKKKLPCGLRQFQESFRTEVSHRNRIDLDVIKVRVPKTCKPW